MKNPKMLTADELELCNTGLDYIVSLKPVAGCEAVEIARFRLWTHMNSFVLAVQSGVVPRGIAQHETQIRESEILDELRNLESAITKLQEKVSEIRGKL